MALRDNPVRSLKVLVATPSLRRRALSINSNGISSAYIDAPFDKGKAILNAKGYHISSLEESAKLRIQENREKDDPYFLYNSHWVSEASLCIPKKGCYITKKSPILNNSREATRIDKEYKDFCLSNEQVQIALSDSIFIPNGIFRIPTKRFGEDDYMRYFFGNTAQEFGELL